MTSNRTMWFGNKLLLLAGKITAINVKWYFSSKEKKEKLLQKTLLTVSCWDQCTAECSLGFLKRHCHVEIALVHVLPAFNQLPLATRHVPCVKFTRTVRTTVVGQSIFAIDLVALLCLNRLISVLVKGCVQTSFPEPIFVPFCLLLS